VTPTVDRQRYDEAPRFAEYLESVVKHAELWRAVYRTAMVAPDAIDQLRAVPGTWRLLALSEDWCSDAVSTLPVIARLAEGAGIDLRVLGRDANVDIMDAHLTSGTRSIPVVIALDGDHRVCGWWGPRPAALQRWFRNEAALLAKEDRTRRKRAWYARDRGKTAVSEILEMIERAGRTARRKHL
jgi:hypothetical protein